MRICESLLKAMLLIVSALVLVACQPAVSPTESTLDDDIQDIRVQRAEPTRTTTKVEQFPLPNCGGTDKLGQSLGMYASANKSATVGAKATVTGGGEVAIPETMKLKLEIQVELAYQESFESANSRLDTIEMSAAAGTHVVYTIVWEEQTFNSIVQYSSGGKVYEAPYTYRLIVPKIDTSYNVACSGDNVGGSSGGNIAATTRGPENPSSPSSPTGIPQEVIAFTVNANQAWQNTGVYLQGNDFLQIDYVSGEWTGQKPFCCSGPDNPPGPAEQDFDCMPMRQTVVGQVALIGKIGDGTPFKVGRQFIGAVSQEGLLYLRMNDCDAWLSDNEGSVIVSIQVK